jgi:hypothetical protein
VVERMNRGARSTFLGLRGSERAAKLDSSSSSGPPRAEQRVPLGASCRKVLNYGGVAPALWLLWLCCQVPSAGAQLCHRLATSDRRPATLCRRSVRLKCTTQEIWVFSSQQERRERAYPCSISLSVASSLSSLRDGYASTGLDRALYVGNCSTDHVVHYFSGRIYRHTELDEPNHLVSAFKPRLRRSQSVEPGGICTGTAARRIKHK